MITNVAGKGSHCSLMIVGLLLGLFMLPASAISEHRPTSPLENRAVITVGSELDYPPYALVDEDGNPDGFSVDLIKAVGKEMGLTLKFVTGPWNKVKGKLMRGEIDLLPLVAYSKERARYFDFSHPHIISRASIFIRKDTDITSAEDLRGKEVIVMRGDANHEYIVSTNLTSKVTLTDSFEEAFKLLAAGKHDFVLAPKLSGLLLLNKLNIRNIQEFGDPIETYGKGYAFAVHKGDKELLDYLDRGLLLIRANGEYNRIYDKWFGDILPRETGNEALVRNVMITASVLLLLILAGMVWNTTLQRQVNARTRELAENEQRFRALFESAADYALVLQIQKEGPPVIIDANLAALKKHGYSREEMVGQPITLLEYPFDQEHHKKIQAQIKAGKVVRFEVTHTCKDGSTFIAEVSAQRIQESDEPLFFAVEHDITERSRHRRRSKYFLRR